MGIGLNVGPLSFHSSGRRRHRKPYRGPNKRFHMVSYWLFGIWALEIHFWMLVAYWWLLWATTAAILGEVAKFRELPAWWGPVMDRTRPPWPKRKPNPVAVSWHPKPIR